MNQPTVDNGGVREAFFLKRHFPEAWGVSTLAQMVMEHFFMDLYIWEKFQKGEG